MENKARVIHRKQSAKNFQIEYPAKNKKPFLSLAEAVEYTNLPRATLYLYTSRNLIPYYKLDNRRVYFKTEDLDRFILNPDNKIGKTEQSESTR